MSLDQIPKILDVKELSARLRVGVATLNRWRCTGEGPAFIKLGHRVGYTVDDINSWLEGERRTFTSSRKKGGDL